jgi:thiol:disulfide interchange protein
MRRAKRITRWVLMLVGAIAYLTALAYLYTRPEVGFRLQHRLSASLQADTNAEGCKQTQTNLSEEAVRQQIERNRQQVQQGVKP